MLSFACILQALHQWYMCAKALELLIHRLGILNCVVPGMCECSYIGERLNMYTQSSLVNVDKYKHRKSTTALCQCKLCKNMCMTELLSILKMHYNESIFIADM